MAMPDIIRIKIKITTRIKVNPEKLLQLDFSHMPILSPNRQQKSNKVTYLKIPNMS